MILGLTRSEVDPCIYYNVDNGSMLYVAVYVDDLLIFSSNQRVNRSLKSNLMHAIKMMDIGEALKQRTFLA